MFPIMPGIAILAFILIPGLGARADGASIWNHNGSTVDLFADGGTRILRYREPRSGMREEGVESGTVLFEGHKSGAAYTGTAYVFSQRCGVFPYAVTGVVSSDQRQITLSGNAPARLDAACRTVGYRADVLRFDFLQSNQPAPIVAQHPVTAPAPTVQTFQYRPPQPADSHTAASSNFSYPSLSDPHVVLAIIALLTLLALVPLFRNLVPIMQVASAAPRQTFTMENTAMQFDPPEPSSPLADDTHQQVAAPPRATDSGKIQLKLRRSQKSGLMGGKPTFMGSPLFQVGSLRSSLPAMR